MRTAFLLSFTFMVTAVPGCRPQQREQTAVSLPDRDVTLPAAATELEFASPVELHQLQVQQITRRPHSARRPEPSPRKARAESPPVPAPGPSFVITDSDPVSTFVDAASEPASDRELSPGKTVTLIPTGSGPSPSPEWTDDFPTSRGTIVHGGGWCPPRNRPGIGIPTRPRPSLY